MAASAANVRVDQAPSDFETSIDIGALFDTNKRGDMFELRVGAGRVLALEHERVLEGAEGARTWVGRLREGGSDNVVYVTESNGNVYLLAVRALTKTRNLILSHQPILGFARFAWSTLQMTLFGLLICNAVSSSTRNGFRRLGKNNST